MSLLTINQKEETWHDIDKKQHDEGDVARKVATKRKPASWCAACAVRSIGLAHNGVQRAHNGVQRAQTASRSAHLPASVLSQAPCPTKCFLFVSLLVGLFVCCPCSTDQVPSGNCKLYSTLSDSQSYRYLLGSLFV